MASKARVYLSSSSPMSSASHILLDVQLLATDIEGIHRDGSLLGVADILAADIFAQTLVGVSGIDHNDVGILFP